MMRIVLLLFLVLLHLPAVAAEPAASPSSEAMGRRLCALLDLSRPGMEAVKREADAGRYERALSAWRDAAVLRLRRADLGSFGWHDYKLHPRQLKIAERLVGRMSEEEYRNSGGGIDFYDIYGMSGAPGTGGEIRWLTISPDVKIHERADYSNFLFAIPLAGSYWKTGERVYLDKWFEIAADFAVRQKPAFDALAPEARKGQRTAWSVDAQVALSQADRVENILRSVAVFAKSLPGGGRPAQWAGVLEPVTEPVAPEARETIPAVALAQIAISLVQDHPKALLDRYLKAGPVPNQRRAGLSALMMISLQFPEFKDSPEIGRQASAALSDYMEGSFYADGAMLEQSFNYNLGDLQRLRELSKLLRSGAPKLAGEIDARLSGFERVMASLSTPLGGLPVVGNIGPENPPALWNDAGLRRKWQEELAKASAAETEPLAVAIKSRLAGENRLPAPAFTSVAFPYAGYYVQRRDWTLDSPYLFFMNARPARGHASMNNNSIQLWAYGRPLLVGDGPPPYTPGFLTDDLRDDFVAIVAYLGEDSSLKSNTVLVDGQSQSRKAVVGLRAETEPIPGRRHTSARFDLVEGHYDMGYGEPYAPWKPSIKTDLTVQHHRQVIFVRDPGFWIVTDAMTSTGDREHEYTQIWNFPPRHGEGKAPVSGFRREEVVADEAARQIRTEDPAGPNIRLMHFGALPLSYVTYFAQKNPYRGWFSRGIGDVIPAVDVHTSWKAKGDSVLMTALWPTKDAARTGPAVVDLSPENDPTQAGLSLTLADGSRVTCRTSRAARSLTAGALTGNAETLLVVARPDGTSRGLALGCTSLSAGGIAVKPASPDFEWEWDGKRLTVVTPIAKPSGFAWKGTAGALMPDYAAAR